MEQQAAVEGVSDIAENTQPDEEAAHGSTSGGGGGEGKGEEQGSQADDGSEDSEEAEEAAAASGAGGAEDDDAAEDSDEDDEDDDDEVDAERPGSLRAASVPTPREEPTMQEQYQEALEEYRVLLERNKELEAIFLEQLEQKSDETQVYTEDHYVRTLALFDRMREDKLRDRQKYAKIIKQYKAKLLNAKLKANDILKTFFTMTRKTASTVKNLLPAKVRELEEAWDSRNKKYCQERQVNLRRQTRFRKLQVQLAHRDDIDDKLQLIDFHQMKMENQAVLEKIEERNEDVLKLRKKTITTVQHLTHIKEKLQHILKQNSNLSKELAAVEDEVQKYRDLVNTTKQEKDKLTIENNRLRQGGAVYADKLLNDFESTRDQRDELTRHLEKLQQQYQALPTKNKRLIDSPSSLKSLK
eukprot:gnl/Hemi2/15473_TR5210_c0_g1_i1.p1 gnl/Hemi2/15473_TR5210_c0_g1~~gnl/Hemi2/15473_TR5210_c0_g1_i1.p1  ORF type:complete len:413 (+),score=96.90 gnl/Hemi2/15473_TR5210_c0_g1_i1:72-1310(+)